MATLLQLKVAIGDWLNVNDQPGQASSTRLPGGIRANMVNMAIRELLRLYDTKYGQFTTTFQTVDQQFEYDAISGFSRSIRFWYLDPADSQSAVEVKFAEKQDFDSLFPVAGTFGDPVFGGGTFGEHQLGDPTYYTFWAGKFQLGLVPHRALTMFVSGYRLLPDLVNDNDENLLTIDASEYVLFKALSLASQFAIEDARVAAWEARARELRTHIAAEHYRAHSLAKRQVQTSEPG